MKKSLLLLAFIVTACGLQKRSEMYHHSPVSLYSSETSYPGGFVSTNLLRDVSGESNRCVVNIDDMPYANTRPCTKAVEGKPRIMNRITKKFHVDASGHVSRPVVKEKGCPKGFEREDVAEGVFDAQVKAIEGTLESMSESGIIWRLPKTAVIMEVNDKSMQDALALAAFQSNEWRHSYGNLYLSNTVEEGRDSNHYEKMNALISRLLLSSRAFSPLEKMLNEGRLRICTVDVQQIETEKFSSLHLTPQATDKEDIYVPVHAYLSLRLEKM